MHLKEISKWTGISVAGLVAVVLLFSGCISSSTPGSGLSGAITEAGSTTVQPLAEKLANAFMAENPRVKITIQGGGSSVGIRSVADGIVDIGATSRELAPDEPPLVKHLLAWDGIAVIVHPSNPVNGLTRAQIRDIFAGTITNWSQIGGINKTIHVAAREEGSGTRTAFEELVMGKGALITKYAILQPSNGALFHVVSGDPQAISFVSFGYLDNQVKALAVDGVPATEANAKSKSYPIVRPLYFLTKSPPTGLVKAFIDYCLGPKGQQIVVEEEYISIS